MNDVMAVPETSKKIYPRLSIDLDQFPDLKGDVDETGELHICYRVCSVQHNEYSHSMDLEITSIAVPRHSHEDVKGSGNEADRSLNKLKSPSRRLY